MRGICRYNKMINCMEQTKCQKCSWNPEYFEELKKKRREEAEAKEAEELNAKGSGEENDKD